MAATPTRRRRFRAVRRLFIGAIAVAGFVGVAAFVFVYREFMETLPPIEAAVDYQPPVTTQIFADDGTRDRRVLLEKRYLVPIDRIPTHVRAGVHRRRGRRASTGTAASTPIGILRAFVNNIVAGGKVQGGSTITQQVVKSLLLTPKKSYERKLKEMILVAAPRAASCRKDEILYLYLNHIYLGSGAYGVAAAAREYFGKDVADLDLAEAALLAGLPQAPSRYSPVKHWPRGQGAPALRARPHGRGRLHRPRDARRRAAASRSRWPAARAASRPRPTSSSTCAALLEERYGRTALYELGLRVHTTVDLRHAGGGRGRRCASGIDALTDAARRLPRRASATWRTRSARHYLRMQDAGVQGHGRAGAGVQLRGRWSPPCAASSARVQVGPFAGDRAAVSRPATASGKTADAAAQRPGPRARRRRRATAPLRFEYDPSPLIEGALIAIDPHTGDVKAMVGGYDFERSQFNRVTQASGSPARRSSRWSTPPRSTATSRPASVIVDEPISFNDNGRVWAPQNYEKKFFGPTTLREALAYSRNVVTVQARRAHRASTT